MSILTEALYRTNKSIVTACDELGILYNEESLEDLAACDACGIWYHEYELIIDEDGLNTCKFCDYHYGCKF